MSWKMMRVAVSHQIRPRLPRRHRMRSRVGRRSRHQGRHLHVRVVFCPCPCPCPLCRPLAPACTEMRISVVVSASARAVGCGDLRPERPLSSSGRHHDGSDDGRCEKVLHSGGDPALHSTYERLPTTSPDAKVQPCCSIHARSAATRRAMNQDPLIIEWSRAGALERQRLVRLRHAAEARSCHISVRCRSS